MDRLNVIKTARPVDKNSLSATLNTLWREKLQILLVAITLAVLGGLYAFKISVPQYISTAVVLLNGNKQSAIISDIRYSDEIRVSERINTEVEIIRSRSLQKSLVKKLHLLKDPEFNDALNNNNTHTLMAFFQNTLIRQKVVLTEEQTLNAVIDNTLSAFSISSIRNSLAVSIRVSTENPDKSALMANTIADLYIQDSLERKYSTIEEANKKLNEKAAELKLGLEASEIKIKQFNDGTQLINAKSLDLLTEQLKDLRNRIAELSARKTTLQSNLDGLEQAINQASLQAFVGIAELERSVDAWNSGIITRKDFDRQVSEAKHKLNKELARVTNQHNTLLASETALNKKVDIQSVDLVQMQQLRREANANELLYESFLARLKEIVAQQDLLEPDGRLLSYATPNTVASPPKEVILALSVLMGILLGSAWVVFREYKNNTFRSTSDVAARTGQKVLGAVPKMENLKRKDVLTYLKSKPTSAFSEAVRNLRTSILFLDSNTSPQVIMTTSSVSGEGKTMHALSLAQSLAGLGNSVIVVEGDVRKRTLSERYNLKDRPGITATMTGKTNLNDAVYRPEGIDFDVLVGESTNVSAVEIFSSPDFGDLIKALRKKYDYIIIDTAPVLVVPDARVIAQYVDINIFIVLWNKTTVSQVNRGIALFESSGRRVSGLVMNKIDSNAVKRYGLADEYNYGDVCGYYDN